jgi:hypothetical protein
MARTYCEYGYLPKYCGAWLEGLAGTLPDPARTLGIGTGSGCSLIATLIGLSRHDDYHCWTVDIEDRPYLDGQVGEHGLPHHYTQIKGDSREVAKSWNQELDWIYIDGDHTYEGCLADIAAWSPFLKFGGLMVFDDYEVPWWSVTEAVDEAMFDPDSEWRFVGQVGRLLAFEKGTKYKRAPWITDFMWEYDSWTRNKEGDKDPWLCWAWGLRGDQTGGDTVRDYGKRPHKDYEDWIT